MDPVTEGVDASRRGMEDEEAVTTKPEPMLGRAIESALGIMLFSGEDSTVPGMAAFAAIPVAVRAAARLGYDAAQEDRD